MEQIKFTADNTIRDHSAIHFSTPSEWAKNNLLYMQMYGNFVCDQRYRVERPGFDSQLLLLTMRGKGILETPQGRSICVPRTLALIDCHQPHLYYADKQWDFLWIHFNGNGSREITERILETQGNVVPCMETSLAYRYFHLLVFDGGKGRQMDELTHSAFLWTILSCIFSYRSEESSANMKRMQVTDAIGYIEKHYCEKISIEDLSRFLSISKSSFYYEFKRETGLSPYDFIMQYRLNRAKELLRLTDFSISRICEQIGFNSEANFIKTFRRRVGMTPRTFRLSHMGPSHRDTKGTKDLLSPQSQYIERIERIEQTRQIEQTEQTERKDE